MFNTFSTYAYGHDFGNAKTCGVAYTPQGQCVALEMASALTPGTMDELMSNVSGASIDNLRTAGIVTDTSHLVAFKHAGKHHSFYGGDLAIMQNPNASMKELTW